ITVESPAQQAADLQAQVTALQAAGVLNQGQANSLIVKLNLKGNSGDIGKVQAFLQEVNDLLGPGSTLLGPGNILLLSVSRREALTAKTPLSPWGRGVRAEGAAFAAVSPSAPTSHRGR